MGCFRVHPVRSNRHVLRNGENARRFSWGCRRRLVLSWLTPILARTRSGRVARCQECLPAFDVTSRPEIDSGFAVRSTGDHAGRWRFGRNGPSHLTLATFARLQLIPRRDSMPVWSGPRPVVQCCATRAISSQSIEYQLARLRLRPTRHNRAARQNEK